MFQTIMGCFWFFLSVQLFSHIHLFAVMTQSATDHLDKKSDTSIWLRTS